MGIKELEEGMLLLCTVKRVVGTTVFVEMDEFGREGTIVTSEIAPGRIRNLRDYVVPNKKIVCKIIKISGDNVNLSLRRVNAKEKKEVLENFEKEKKAITIVKMICGESCREYINEIVEKYGQVYLFFQKKDEKEICRIFGKDNGEKLIEILSKVKEKKIEINKKIKVFLKEESIEKLKKIFSSLPAGFRVRYISSPNYEITLTSKDYKEANRNMEIFITKVKEEAKKENILIED